MFEVIAIDDGSEVFRFVIKADDEEAAEETVSMLNSTSHPDIDFILSEEVA
jgi:hypothetical protein